MNNVIPLPTTDVGRRALREARGHRKSALIWLLSKLNEHESDYTRRQAIAVLHAWRGRWQITFDAARWLSVMCASFDEQAKSSARFIRKELCGA